MASESGGKKHAAAQSRLAAHGARRREQQAGCVMTGAPGRAPAEMCGGAAWSARRWQAKGGSAGGSDRIIAKCTAKGDERVMDRNHTSRKSAMIQKYVQRAPRPGLGGAE